METDESQSYSFSPQFFPFHFTCSFFCNEAMKKINTWDFYCQDRRTKGMLFSESENLTDYYGAFKKTKACRHHNDYILLLHIIIVIVVSR